MTLADMPQHDFNLGVYQTPQNQQFQITARLFEMTDKYDYWLVAYDAHHQQWGHMRFSLMIPKTTARNTQEASTITTGTATDQVKAILNQSGPAGRPLALTMSPDGWILI